MPEAPAHGRCVGKALEAPSGEGSSLELRFTRLSGFVAFGEPMQPFLIAQHDALSAALDQPLLLPCTEYPADGMQRRPCHFSNVLAADRKVDLDAGSDFSSRLFGEAEQDMGDALLDLLVRHLHDASLRILQAAADNLQRICGEARIFCDQAIPGRRGPGKGDAVDRGHGGRRVVRQIHRLRDTEEFAGRDVADNGLVPLRRDLFDAEVAMSWKIFTSL